MENQIPSLPVWLERHQWHSHLQNTSSFQGTLIITFIVSKWKAWIPSCLVYCCPLLLSYMAHLHPSVFQQHCQETLWEVPFRSGNRVSPLLHILLRLSSSKWVSPASLLPLTCHDNDRGETMLTCGLLLFPSFPLHPPLPLSNSSPPLGLCGYCTISSL